MEAVTRAREFFESGKTLDVEFRLAALRRLKQVLREREADVAAALQADLGKSAHEAYMCETGMTLAELSYQIGHLRRWARPQWRPTGLANFHAGSRVVAEPKGCVLVMSPWNYPFMLAMEPLVGAVAAGCTVVVKPSAYSPATSALIAQICEQVFEPGHVECVLGGRAENAALLDERFDHIFFTGSKAVGRLVLEKAAPTLTPVTLELGGKSPCIVCEDANLNIAAARVAFGKFLNCGQTCVAPDYLLVHESVHDEFLEKLRARITSMYGELPLANPDYGRMVNEKHFARVCGLIDAAGTGGSGARVVHGGGRCADTLQIEPTVVDGCTLADALMGEEIFGPVLPVLTFRSLDEAFETIRTMDKPLAAYVFTSSKATERRVLRELSFGGGCVNDTIVHLATSAMGFGGVGASGMGSYHGIESWRTFSHEKSILKKYTWLDLPLRYQPYRALYNKVVHLFLR